MLALVAAPAGVFGVVPARADGSPCHTAQSCVVVEVFGAGPTPVRTVQFSRTQLMAMPDQEGGFYESRPDGLASDIEGPGVPIAELISQAGAASVNYAFIFQPSSSRASSLSSTTRDFDPPGTNDFVTGGGPQRLQPIVYPVGSSSSGTLGYVRPLHADDPHDANDDDFLYAAPGLALTIELHMSGQLLNPTISATPTTVHVGDTVSFTATAPNAPSGVALTWSWTFGDDGGAGTRMVTHRFTTAGTYYAQVAVTGSDGSSGTSNTVKVAVRGKKTPKPPAATGPGRGAGSTTNPIAGPVAGSGSRYNAKPSASPTPTGGPASPTAAGSEAAPASSASARLRTSAPASSPADRLSGGQRVVGFALVDPAGTIPTTESAVAAPAAAAAAARAGGQRVRASLAWVGLACILALLLAGAGLERRRAIPGAQYGRKRRRQR